MRGAINSHGATSATEITEVTSGARRVGVPDGAAEAGHKLHAVRQLHEAKAQRRSLHPVPPASLAPLGALCPLWQAVPSPCRAARVDGLMMGGWWGARWAEVPRVEYGVRGTESHTLNSDRSTKGRIR